MSTVNCFNTVTHQGEALHWYGQTPRQAAPTEQRQELIIVEK